MITSKQPILGLTQELVFSRICESTTGYTFTPCVGSFTSPGIDTRQKGPPAFSVSSERQYNIGINCNMICKFSDDAERPSVLPGLKYNIICSYLNRVCFKNLSKGAS